MSTHWRNSFYRTSVNGNVHRVSGHNVDRDSWDSGSSPGTNDGLLRYARAHAGATARQVVPNAECPVCGQPVFFYQNAHGSRVFFDELGPPWPKHPCTAVSANDLESAEQIAPTYEDLRTQIQYDFVQLWAGADGDSTFRSKYGRERWDIAVVSACYSNVNGTVLVLSGPGPYRYFLVPDKADLHLPQGHLVTLNGNSVSFVSPIGLQPVELRLERANAKRALHCIVGMDLVGDTAE